MKKLFQGPLYRHLASRDPGAQAISSHWLEGPRASVCPMRPEAMAMTTPAY